MISEDLLFWSRIHGLAGAAGREVARASDDAALGRELAAGGIERVLADLSCRSIDVLAWARRFKALDPPPELIAYGPHVADSLLAEAAKAGFDRAMPNSRLHRMLPELVSGTAALDDAN